MPGCSGAPLDCYNKRMNLVVTRAPRPQGEALACRDCAATRMCWPGESAARAGATVRRCAPLRRGTRLWAAGDAFLGIYLVTHGCIRLRASTQADRNGAREPWIDFALPGDLLGVEGVIDNLYTFDADAIDDSAVCRVEWSPDADCDGSAAMSRELLRRECRARQALRDSIASQSSDAAVTVQRFLARIAQRIGVPDGDALQLKLPMTRAEIARHLDLAEETVIRAMQKLEAQGVLQRKGRTLRWLAPQDACAAPP